MKVSSKHLPRGYLTSPSWVLQGAKGFKVHCTIEALILSTAFGGPLCYKYNKDPLNSISFYLN